MKFSIPTLKLIVIGDRVSIHSNLFPEVRFIDIPIEREINLIADSKALLQLYRTLKIEKPTIVHSIMPKAGLLSAIAGFLSGTPIRLHTFTGQKWATCSGFKKLLLIYLDKLVTHLNTNCYTDSTSQSEFLFANGIKVNDKPLATIGKGSLSGVDLDRFNTATIQPSKTELRSQLNIPLDDIIYIYLGRKCQDKGTFELISAFEQLSKQTSKIHLLLVGPDESLGEIESLLKKLKNLNIHNLPATQTPEVFLNGSDIFCIPSYREGFGTVVIEAAALGVPAIGSKIPGLTDSIVDGITGILVNPKDDKALMAAMEKLSQEPDTLKKLSSGSKDNVRKHFDAKKVVSQLHAEYKKLIAE